MPGIHTCPLCCLQHRDTLLPKDLLFWCLHWEGGLLFHSCRGGDGRSLVEGFEIKRCLSPPIDPIREFGKKTWTFGGERLFGSAITREADCLPLRLHRSFRRVQQNLRCFSKLWPGYWAAGGLYNMEWVHVISWLTFLVASGRVLAFMCEPPCTTFSIMRRPPLRSRLCPFGFRPKENQTHNGNLLCQRSCQLLFTGMQNDAIGLLEKPFTSLMKHMPSYKALLAKDTVFEVRTDSCMFGSIHQKSFALLGFGLDPEPFVRRCDKQHKHVKVEGAYTKASATYTKELAEKIASSFKLAIIKKKQELRDDGDLPKAWRTNSSTVWLWSLSGRWRRHGLLEGALTSTSRSWRRSRDLLLLWLGKGSLFELYALPTPSWSPLQCRRADRPPEVSHLF